jgi:MFS family permease
LYPFAALGGAGSLLATSFTQPNAIWQQFLAQGLLFGLTVSFGVQPALAIAGQYFKGRRAMAMGIVASGSSAGGVCLPIMFSRLVPVIGFPWAMRVGALLVLFCYVAAMCVSRAKYPPKQLQSASDLLDFNGFRDIRYALLALCAVIANLGLYVPYYYIGECKMSF